MDRYRAGGGVVGAVVSRDAAIAALDFTLQMPPHSGKEVRDVRSSEPFLLTVEQYRELPQRQDVVQELRWGSVVTLTFPKKKQTQIQSRLLELLAPYAAGKGLLAVELPFRAVPEYDLRAADVAFVMRREGGTNVYEASQRIPLRLIACEIKASDIFC